MRGPDRVDGQRVRRKLLASGSGGNAGSEGPVLRSSGSTLHARTFSVDGHRLFIGSQPGTGRLQRWVIRVLSRLPIEWLL
jgi:hypothetical protein